MEPRAPSPRGRDRCASWRELISAALDGETTASEDAEIDAHVASCPDCARFHDAAAAMTRRLRLRSTPDDQADVEQVLSQLRLVRLGRGAWTRPVLVWCALIITAQSFGPLVLADADGASAHVARHVGASGIALACGLLYVAWKPHRAFGLLPFVGALCLATVLSAVIDTINGDRSAFAEAVHLAEVAGTVVLWMVAGSPGWERIVNVVRPNGSGALRSTR